MNRVGAMGVAAALMAAGIAIACSEDSSHPFGGRAYEDSRGCLDPGTSIDVVDGPDPGSTCDPKCIVSPPDPDGGLLTLYVSTMCAPFPHGYDTSGHDPRCPDALAAYTQNVTCLADGGIANRADGGDAGNSHAGCASSSLPLVCLPSPDSDPCPTTRASLSVASACQSLHVYEETCGAYDAVLLFGASSATVLYFEGATGNLIAVAKQDTQTSSAVTCTSGPDGFVLPTCPPLGAEICNRDAGSDAAPE